MNDCRLSETSFAPAKVGYVGENHGRIEEYAFRTSLSMTFTEWQREAIHAR